MVVNSGQAMPHWMFSKVVIDMATLQIGGQRKPALLGHDKRIGWTEKLSVDGGRLLAEGRFLKRNPDAADVRRDAEDGFPWQASMQLEAGKHRFLDDDEVMEVNGATFAGPGVVWHDARLREVSFVELGADENTSAESFASDVETVEITVERAENKMAEDVKPPAAPTAEQLKAQHAELFKQHGDGAVKAERERVAKILSKASKFQSELAQKLISDGAGLAEAFEALLDDANKKLEAQAKRFAADRDEPVGGGDTDDADGSGGDVDDDELDAEQFKAKLRKQWDKSKALRSEFGGSFDTYLAFAKADSKGLIQLKDGGK
jgi:hypothetical protein